MHEEETVGKQSEVQTVNFMAEMPSLEYPPQPKAQG